MSHIPSQRMDPSQPLLHEQVLFTQVPLLLQSMSFSQLVESAKKDKNVLITNAYIGLVMQVLVDNTQESGINIGVRL